MNRNKETTEIPLSTLGMRPLSEIAAERHALWEKSGQLEREMLERFADFADKMGANRVDIRRDSNGNWSGFIGTYPL